MLKKVLAQILSKQTEIQSLIFDTEKFSESEAKRWASERSFSADKVDKADGSLRIRQRDPGEFEDDSFRTISVTDGVKAVIGAPKKKSEKASNAKNRGRFRKEHEEVLRHLDLAMDSQDIEEMRAHIQSAVNVLASYEKPADETEKAKAVKKEKFKKDRQAFIERLAEALKSGDMYEAKKFAEEALSLVSKDIEEFESLSAVLGEMFADEMEPVPPRTIKRTKSADGKGWDLDIEIPIFKVDDEQRLVAGIVYEPDVVDAQGDSAAAEEIEKACHDFMLNSMKIGLMHKDDISSKARIVENYITKNAEIVGNQKVRKGTWVMVVKVLDDEIWTKVKSGELTGFSMAGYASDAEASQAA